jgi:hypothetical protein
MKAEEYWYSGRFIWTQKKYLNSRAYSIKGQLNDQSYSLGKHRHKKREDKFDLFMRGDSIDEAWGVSH